MPIVARAGAGACVVGFAVAWLLQSELEILRVGVAPAERRRGVARDLVRELLSRAVAGGAEVAWLEVGASNLSAVRLYAEAGFKNAGVREGYYGHDGQDAVIMRRSLSDRARDEGGS